MSWSNHDMEMFSSLLVFCEENPPVDVDFPHEGPVIQTFDDFFVVSMNMLFKFPEMP